MALGESADDTRSSHREVTGDTEADVTERDGRGVEAGSGGEGPYITGWEAERGIWLETERTRRIQAQAKIESSQVEDNEYAREHIDSKALAEERERKEALGIHMG